MKKLNRVCPICLCQYGTPIKNIAMVLPDDMSIPCEYEVVCCRECGFAFADVDASQDIYDKYYRINNNYRYSSVLKAEMTESVNHLRYQILSKYVDKSTKILDVGCGSGELLRLLKKNGYKNLYGLDPSEKSIEKLREQGIQGDVKNIFDDVEEKHRHVFDFIMSTSVIEHIYDLNAFVKQLLCYLVPGKGQIYVDAPAVEGFCKYYHHSANYFNQEHINYFSLISLDNMFSKYGCVRISSDAESITVIDEEQPGMVITAIYKNTKDEARIKNDSIAQISIQNYFKRDQHERQNVYDRIKKFMQENGNRIVIWGTGAYTMQLLQNIPELQKTIVYFIDNNIMKIGKKILGRQVFAPEKLLQDNISYPILICSIRNSADIERQINKMRIKNCYLSI